MNNSTRSSNNYEVIIDKVGDKLEYVPKNCEKMLSTLPDNMPVVILSVAGKTRIGFEGFDDDKLRFDRKGDDSFKYASGNDSVTSGLHSLCRPFIINNPSNASEKMAVYLVDSQGLDALDQEGGVDQVLFALTNFLSSHIIYNVLGNIKPRQLLNLTVLANHSVSVDKENLPSLDIVVRDAKYTSNKFDKMINQYNEYESSILSVEESNLRNDFMRLTEYFKPDCVHVYPFPFPGEKVEKSAFNGDVKDIRKCFIQIIHHYIVTSLDPKNLVPKFKSKSELLSIFGSMCDNILKLQKSGTDIFYEMITESHNNRLVFEYDEKYLTPLKGKCYKLSSSEFEVEYRKCADMLEEMMNKCQGGSCAKKPIKKRILTQLNELKEKNVADEQRKKEKEKMEKELEEERKKLEMMKQNEEQYRKQEQEINQMMELIKTLAEKINEPPIIEKEESGWRCTIF